MLQEKNRNLLLTLILTAAAAVRIACLIKVWNTPVLKIPIIDSQYYHQWATSLAAGGAGEKDVFFMSPLYPFILSLIYRILGAYTQAAATFQALGGIALVWLMYLLGKRLFNADVGLLAALFAAFYRPFIYYEDVLLSAVLILLLNAAALLFLLSEPRKDWKDVLAGLLLGLSALARPNVLLFAGILAIVMLVRSDLGGWKRAVLLLLGLFLVLAPTAERNHRLCGEWVLTTSGFGMNFYSGNNAAAEGIYWEAPFLSSAEPQYENLDYRREASRLAGHKLSLTGTSRFWAEQGFLFITHQPLEYLKLLSRKLFLFFHTTEIPNNFSLYAAEDYSPLLRYIPFTFGLLAPLGMAFWLTSQCRSGAALVNVYGLSYLLATLIFFAASEYRLPLLLILLPMTAAGLQTLWQRYRSGRTPSALSLLAVALMIALPVNMPTQFTAGLQSPYMDFFNLGSVLQKKGRYQESIPLLQRSLVMKPEFAEGHKLLGDSYHILGMRELAAEEFRRAGLDAKAELNARDAESLFDRAQALAGSGQRREAINLYMQGLAIHPDPPAYVYFNIAYLALTTGDTLQAEQYLQQAATADPQEARVPFLLGLIAESRSQWPQAAEKFREDMGIQPDNALARAHAALAVLRTGDKTEASRLIEPLLNLQTEDPTLQAVIDLVAGEVGY